VTGEVEVELQQLTTPAEGTSTGSHQRPGAGDAHGGGDEGGARFLGLGLHSAESLALVRSAALPFRSRTIVRSLLE
jgi:hypothetical protein